jgi:hypothetical protein
MNARYLRSVLTLIGAGLAAWIAADLTWLPAYHLFDRLLPGERLDDMNLLGFLPYVAVLPVAVLATTIAHRRRWPLYMAPILGGLASAVLTFANGVLLVRSLTH